jgi:NADPH:quinone reductase-like Zn-dependent oxidoreductase
MKAIVYTEYGSPDVLHLSEVEKPVPKSNELLIRIKATAANSGDCRIRGANPFAVRFIFGFIKPKINILGGVFSGKIEAIGNDVKRFKIDDMVFGSTDMHFGTYAEYICLPESGTLTLKPANLSHTEAAVIPFGGTTALYFLRRATVKPGQNVIVIGASGAVGSAAVQLAKILGATVTGVCSTANVELVKSLGADYVIDYTKQDFTQNGERYDVIFDTVDTISISRSLQSLTKKGKIILSAAMSKMVQAVWVSMTSDTKVLTGVTSITVENIKYLKELAEAGTFKPVIDKIYPLAQMAEAHTYVEKGHKRGNVAITV